MRFSSTTRLLVGSLSLMNRQLFVTRFTFYDYLLSLYAYMYTDFSTDTHMNGPH